MLNGTVRIKLTNPFCSQKEDMLSKKLQNFQAKILRFANVTDDGMNRFLRSKFSSAPSNRGVLEFQHP